MRTFRLRRFELRRSPEGERRAVSVPPPFVVRPVRTMAGTGRVRGKRLSWEASPDPAVQGYRVYWEVGNNVGYGSTFADVGKVTSLLLPHDLPSFPLVSGRMEIGITSVSKSGNESDMRVLSAYLDFGRPEAPRNVKIENTEGER